VRHAISADLARITPPGSDGSRRADQVDLCASPHHGAEPDARGGSARALPVPDLSPAG